MTAVFTPKTLAERWQCSVHTVRNLVHDGKIQAFRVGHEFRVTDEEVRRFESRAAPMRGNDIEANPM